jgi:uncharacterized protein (UPF0332 family)
MEQSRASFEDARILLENSTSHFGTVNRSYYAMFYAVLAILQLHELIPKKHTGALSLFDTEFVLKGAFPKELSKHLHRAFDLRQSSDYQVTQSVSLDEAKDILDKADVFVKAVEEYIKAR